MLDKISELGKAVATALIQGDSVVLPGIGALSPLHVPAIKKSTNEGSTWHPPKVSVEWKPSRSFSQSVVDVVDPTHYLQVGDERVGKKTSKWVQFDGFDYEQIRSEVQNSGIVQFSPLGQLRSVQNGIVLDVSSEFSTAINAKYSQLTPVSLTEKGALEETSALITPPEEVKTAIKEENIDLAAPKGAISEPHVTLDTKREAVVDPVKSEPESGKSPLRSTKSLRSTKPLHLKTRRSHASMRSLRSGSSRSALLLVSGICLIGLAVVLLKPWQWSPGEPTSSLTQAAEDDSSMVANENAGDPLQADSSRYSESDSTLSDPNATTSPPSTSTTDPASTSGQRPTNTTAASAQNSNKVFTPETIGYTIIVRSALSKTVAEAGIAEMAQLNLPMGILEGESNGTIRFRLGLGVYTTAADATKAIAELGDSIPEGSWVYRIR